LYKLLLLLLRLCFGPFFPPPLHFYTVQFNMHKLSNLAGGVRHGWEIPFGNNRSQQHHNQPYQQQQRPPTHSSNAPAHLPLVAPITWCFNVPLNHNLTGPDPDQIIYSSQGATERWTFLKGTTPDDNTPNLLPVHRQNLENLSTLCTRMKSECQADAIVTVGRASNLAPLPGLQSTQTNNLVASVCVHSSQYDYVRKAREAVLNNSPITLVGIMIFVAFVIANQSSNLLPCPSIAPSLSMLMISS
jgi:hypothetical protein